MTFKILPELLVISLLPQHEAWGETKKQVIKCKMENTRRVLFKYESIQLLLSSEETKK